MRTLRATLSILRIQTATGLQYRFAAVSNATISIFWAIIEVVVMTVFYTYARNASAGADAGLSLPQAVSYIWLAQAMMGLTSHSADPVIVSLIQKGDVGVELCRPLDLFAHWYARAVATRVAPFLIRGGITILSGLLMPIQYRMGPPASLAGFTATILCVIGAVALASAISTFAHSIMLNIAWGQGPIGMFFLLTTLLSGAYLPLQLWPGFMQTFLRYQPFAGVIDIPARFYVGTLPPGALPGALAVQLLWAALFVLAGRLIMRRNLKRLVVQGG